MIYGNLFISFASTSDVSMMNQPQLGDEVRDWYWQLVERFRFIHDFYKDFTLQSYAEFILLGYRLLPLLGCKELAMTRFRHDAYFSCGDMIVKYWVEFAPEPKRELRKRIKELEEKLENELFSLNVSFTLFDVTIGLGKQPRIESALGTYRVQQIWLSYESAISQRVGTYLKWYFTSAKSYPMEYVVVNFSSPSVYEIDYNLTRSKEHNELAIAILTDIYNNRGMLINYINKAHDFLMQFVKGLAIYLLY